MIMSAERIQSLSEESVNSDTSPTTQVWTIHGVNLPAREDILRRWVETPEETRNFLKAAIAEGAHLIVSPRISEDRWIRSRNIIGSYYGSIASLEDLGNNYKVTRHGIITPVSKQAIEQTLTKGMRLLWDNCSDETKQRLPFDQIPLYKPKLTLNRSLNESLNKGGVTVNAVRMFQEGQTPEQISQALGLAPSELKIVFDRVSRWGVQISDILTQREKRDALVKTFQDPKVDDKALQSAYSQVKRGALLTSLLVGENPILLSLFKLLREAGYRVDTRGLAAIAYTLETQIPIGQTEPYEVKSGKHAGQILIYYFVAATQRERIIEVARDIPSLARFWKDPATVSTYPTPGVG